MHLSIGSFYFRFIHLFQLVGLGLVLITVSILAIGHSQSPYCQNAVNIVPDPGIFLLRTGREQTCHWVLHTHTLLITCIIMIIIIIIINIPDSARCSKSYPEVNLGVNRNLTHDRIQPDFHYSLSLSLTSHIWL